MTCSLDQIVVGEPLPGALYIYLDFRFITYRAAGDVIDRHTYDRFEFKKVRNLFIQGMDVPKFKKWVEKFKNPAPAAGQSKKADPAPSESKEFTKAREDAHRKTMDIFQSQHPDKMVMQTITASKKLVAEVMKVPYAVKTLGQLQTFSRGTVDHSVNVSVLSVYLAMQMGYSHSLILQHVGVGALLHDVGKTKIPLNDSDPPEVVEKKMKDHPTYGMRLIESQPKVPNEVKMIIAQHHECHDGSGFPKKLRGSSIYDLARIVSIANVFDELVGDGQGTLLDRQRNAIMQLDQVLFRKFDPQKLEKALRILKLGV